MIHFFDWAKSDLVYRSLVKMEARMERPIEMDGFFVTMFIGPSSLGNGLLEAEVDILYDPASPPGVTIPPKRWHTPHPIITTVSGPETLKRLVELTLGEYTPPPTATSQWNSAFEHVVRSMIIRWPDLKPVQ